ncbi:MAG: hypothetical protein ACJAT4_003367, partial [Granulosicoccus sp.]
ATYLSLYTSSRVFDTDLSLSLLQKTRNLASAIREGELTGDVVENELLEEFKKEYPYGSIEEHNKEAAFKYLVAILNTNIKDNDKNRVISKKTLSKFINQNLSEEFSHESIDAAYWNLKNNPKTHRIIIERQGNLQLDRRLLLERPEFTTKQLVDILYAGIAFARSPSTEKYNKKKEEVAVQEDLGLVNIYNARVKEDSFSKTNQNREESEEEKEDLSPHGVIEEKGGGEAGDIANNSGDTKDFASPMESKSENHSTRVGVKSTKSVMVVSEEVPYGKGPAEEVTSSVPYDQSKLRHIEKSPSGSGSNPAPVSSPEKSSGSSLKDNERTQSGGQ